MFKTIITSVVVTTAVLVIVARVKPVRTFVGL
jgi:hypothetical protein